MSRIIDDEEELKDYGLIEIDGVNVTECEFREENKNLTSLKHQMQLCNTRNNSPYCEYNHNCYFKQLQRLKKENEELKKYQYQQEYLDKEIETAQENLKIKEEEARHYLEEAYKYRQALEEIREIAKAVIVASNCSNCDGVGYYDGCEDVTCGDYATRKIFEKINEVLNDNASA